MLAVLGPAHVLLAVTRKLSHLSAGELSQDSSGRGRGSEGWGNGSDGWEWGSEGWGGQYGCGAMTALV